MLSVLHSINLKPWNSILESVLLHEPVRSLGQCPHAEHGEQHGRGQQPGEAAPRHHEREAEGEDEAETLGDVQHVGQAAAQILAGDLGDVY